MTILTALTYSIWMLFFCMGIYAVRYYIEFVKVRSAKNDIALLNAKIMALRMALKVRVKIKVNSFRSRFSKFIEAGGQLEHTLNSLSDNKYETGIDFETYFKISKEVVAHMKADLRIAAVFNELAEEANMGENESDSASEVTSKQLFNEFCGPDFKNEISLVRVIKEITDTTNKLSRKINEFNQENSHKKDFKPMQKVRTLDFPTLKDINVIFIDSEILLKQLQESKSKYFIHAA